MKSKKVYLDGEAKKSFDLGRAIRTGAVRPFTRIGEEVERMELLWSRAMWRIFAVTGWVCFLILAYALLRVT